MNHVRFSDHAEYQLRERSISKILVRDALELPDRTIRQNDGRFRTVKLLAKRDKKYALVVIYEETGDTKRVITAFLSSKIKKYLL